jgi:hypothetical protein
MSRFDIMQEHRLDGRPKDGEGRRPMTRTPLVLALAAAAALAGCNKQSHTIVAGEPGDNDGNVAANGPIALPPSITASKVYRCDDNKIVYVDWLSDNKSANIRTDKGGNPTVVATADPTKPMTAAGGYSLQGSASAASVKIAVPGHPEQSCKA